MSTSAATWQLAWQVHFTRRRLPWPAEPWPLLALWEPGDLAGWLDTEDLPDGLPFLLDPEGRYDVELNRYFLRVQISAAPLNTQRAIAYDLANWLRFLWANRWQTDWRDATSDDRAAYQRWRRRDPAGPHHRAGPRSGRVTAVVLSVWAWPILLSRAGGRSARRGCRWAGPRTR